MEVIVFENCSRHPKKTKVLGGTGGGILLDSFGQRIYSTMYYREECVYKT